MKNKWIKRFGILFAFVFLFIGTGCTSNPYKGSFCGNAKNPSTEYGKIRFSYIVDYVADKEEFSERFVMKEDKSLQLDTSDAANYLFVLYTNYYSKETDEIKTEDYQKAVTNYLANKFSVEYNPDYNVEEENSSFYTGEDEEKVKDANNYLNQVKNASSDLVRRVKNPNTDKDGGNNNPYNVYNRLQKYSKACFVVGKDIKDPDGSGVTLSHKTWKDAFKTKNVLNFTFVYPMAWLISVFVNLFGGTGAAQVGAILLVTLIVKVIVMLVTFKGTMSTHKMQDIQPEIAKIQAKYGANPSQDARARMGMEMMNVYKKYNIKPFAPFLSLIVTFPIFISMYRAVSQTAVLRTGNFLGVVLGTTISQNIFGKFKIGALIIFLVMAATQILSMKIPNILNRKRMTYEAKKAQKQTSMMTNIFMVMILVMGFMMPATMSIYWIASAIVQVLQSIIMHHINNASKGKGRYKLKKVEKTYTIPKGTSTKD